MWEKISLHHRRSNTLPHQYLIDLSWDLIGKELNTYALKIYFPGHRKARKNDGGEYRGKVRKRSIATDRDESGNI